MAGRCPFPPRALASRPPTSVLPYLPLAHRRPDHCNSTLSSPSPSLELVRATSARPLPSLHPRFLPSLSFSLHNPRLPPLLPIRHQPRLWQPASSNFSVNLPSWLSLANRPPLVPRSRNYSEQPPPSNLYLDLPLASSSIELIFFSRPRSANLNSGSLTMVPLPPAIALLPNQLQAPSTSTSHSSRRLSLL